MLYLGFVLTAMGTDYYPRLSGVAHDRAATNAMVNEQTEVVLLLSGPIILGMLTFVPQVIGLLYTSAFHDSIAILRWQVMGDLFKVASWPLAYILLAQGRSWTYFCTELSWNVIYVLLVTIGLKQWGLEIMGIAFFISYIVYLILLWLIVSRSFHFNWDKNNVKLLSMLLVCTVLVSIVRLYHGIIPVAIGIFLTSATSWYSLRRMAYSLGSSWWKRMY